MILSKEFDYSFENVENLSQIQKPSIFSIFQAFSGWYGVFIETETKPQKPKIGIFEEICSGVLIPGIVPFFGLIFRIWRSDSETSYLGGIWEGSNDEISLES